MRNTFVSNFKVVCPLSGNAFRLGRERAWAYREPVAGATGFFSITQLRDLAGGLRHTRSGRIAWQLASTAMGKLSWARSPVPSRENLDETARLTHNLRWLVVTESHYLPGIRA